jgi:hypothetical protein
MLIWCADWLPWPHSETLMAWAYVVRGITNPRLLRRAISWARHHRTGRGGQWALALSLLSNLGRFVAIESLAGLRDPEVRRRHIRLEGEEHLQQAQRRGGVVLIGLHAGAPGAWLNLRLMGYRLVFAGGLPHRRHVGEAWRPFLDPEEHLRFSETLPPAARAASLLRARQRILDGATLFMAADGGGRERFRVPIPGGAVSIKSGWWVLRKDTGASVLPVLHHLEGRTQVVTVHPPLPEPVDEAQDIAACGLVLARLLDEHLRRVPGQGVGYALGVWA